MQANLARLATVGLLVLLIAGIAALFRMRFESGADYPPYSSFRADGEGTKLLYDSLKSLQDVEVSRKLLPFTEEPEHDATLLYFGLHPVALAGASPEELSRWEAQARAGNRVILALREEHGYKPKRDRELSIEKQWGIQYELDANGKPLWKISQAHWMPTSTSDGRVLAIERAFGSGSIILIFSAKPFTNQALAEAPDSRRIAPLVSGRRRILFDESHHRVLPPGTIAGLMQRYRLGGALFGLLLLAILFMWHAAGGFPPPHDHPAPAIEGRDSRTGFIRLLAARIPRSQVIDLCVSEWRRSFPNRTLEIPAHAEPVHRYRLIQEQLARK